MVCTANDLSEWKDFPKGLRILLLDENNNSAAEIRSKLEAMDYVVSTFCNENDALSAISSGPENFHVAIVEISNNNSGGLKFLDTAKDLPTVMTSEVQCLNTMMKCIALGAVEFLKKPLSEDKLRNIWQHVVHKAFNAGGIAPSKSLKPIKESVISLLHLPLQNGTLDVEKPEEAKETSPGQECFSELSPGKDRYPAPSTPQLKLCERLLDDGDCQDHTNCSTGKVNSEQFGESKSVETTCDNSMVEVNVPVGQLHTPLSTVIKEEDNSAEGSKSENSAYLEPQNEEIQRDPCSGAEKSKIHPGGTNKTNRKKLKVDWTPELHKKFVKAVEQLGIDRAIPSKILELMKADGLTRHNVASHLQKYRMQKRNILPKEDDRRWAQRGQIQRNHYMHKPIMAFPAYYPHPAIPAAPQYAMWAAPPPHPASMHMCASPYYHSWSWQQTDNCSWKQYPALQADTWGCPVMQSPQGFCSPTPQNTPVPQCNNFTDRSYPMPCSGVEPEEDVIDKVVKEAICKPWLPLPLGLKPPSAESVLAELSRQGISNILPHINSSNTC